ncbi:hypothetical protein I6H07_23245 (plasmid) [Hafnia alvei]|uniref:hypothetical protein n=1 Tax=Hafnia alvei TaxID=569 RepID=UPI000B703D7C|nr:hypothetical protein [Hafnia alvei]MBI0278644.1 hypothetical protein [Hafnia alvei]PNL03936.1 hypothetical protein CEQ28_000660 [Hafnia alvei]
MKPHFDPEITAPESLDDDELTADSPIISSDKPKKRPLYDQPKVQIAALAIFAILGLTWQMSGSSTPAPAQPQFTAAEPVEATAPVPVTPPPEPESSPSPSQPAALAQDTPSLAPPETQTDSFADEVSRALNAQQVYSEKTREGLTALARRLDHVEQQLSEIHQTRQAATTVIATPVQTASMAKSPVKSTKTSTKTLWSGHKAKINSLYPGLAWVTWQGSSWALRPGDRFAGATVLRIDESKREVVTSSGVIR